jgi:hypothetical protein
VLPISVKQCGSSPAPVARIGPFQFGQHALDFLVVLTQNREHVRHLSP